VSFSKHYAGVTPKSVIGGIMLRFLFLAMGLTCSLSHAAIAELSGFDVRKKTDRYELMLGPDNDLLEERDLVVFKINKSGRSKILSGTVVLTATHPAQDIEAIYKSDRFTLQLGALQPNTDKRTGKRLVVVRMNELSKKRKTLVFESKELLNSN
jgi:hypothetical protein